MKVNACNLTLKLLIKLEIIMKQTFLRLDTLIEVSWSGQKIKCPGDVSIEIVAFFEKTSSYGAKNILNLKLWKQWKTDWI